MNPSNRIAPMIAVAALAAINQAQVIPSGSGYLFRAKYTRGAVLKYNLEATVLGLGQKPSEGIKVQFVSTMVVTDVKAGVATVRLDLGMPSANGQSVKGVSGNTAVVRLDNRNRSMDGPTITNTTAQFPGNAVKVGGTWVAQVPVTIGGSSKPTLLQTTYKLVGLKTVNGKRVAVLTMTVGGTASGNGTLMIAANDGSIYGSTMNIVLKTGPTSSYPVRVSIKRVSP